MTAVKTDVDLELKTETVSFSSMIQETVEPEFVTKYRLHNNTNIDFSICRYVGSRPKDLILLAAGATSDEFLIPTFGASPVYILVAGAGQKKQIQWRSGGFTIYYQASGTPTPGQTTNISSFL
ncbi:hypothetical protein ACQP1G_29745 [Nocardia sp. CA-107356]|uniref:hypothetical protein n=1 Tax=Nocardia sp. CA-107356 TaxID=3239972 RepID=UPI003D92410C